MLSEMHELNGHRSLSIQILYGYLMTEIIHNNDDDDEDDKVESDNGHVGKPSVSVNIRSARTYICMYLCRNK